MSTNKSTFISNKLLSEEKINTKEKDIHKSTMLTQNIGNNILNNKNKNDLQEKKTEIKENTQGELNEMYENPEMDICSKYSYISNAILIPLFYIYKIFF